MTTRRGAMSWVVASTLALSSSAWADDKAAAEQLFRIGAAAYKDGKFGAAASNFEQAYASFQAPEIAFSAAQAHRLQYGQDSDPTHVKRAIELFEAYLAGAPSGNKREDAKAHLARLRDVLAKLEASGQKVLIVEKTTPSIYVSVAIEGALITIDGKAVDRYTSIDVSPGEHVVGVTAEGYLPEERKLTVTKGQAMVPVELRPQPASLTVRTVREARVAIDGRPMVVGSRPIEVAPGKRLVTVFARGRVPITREVELRPGQTLSWDAPLERTTQRKAVTWVVVGSGALVAASLVTGVVSIVSGSSAADLRDSETPLSADDSSRYERLRDRRDAFGTTSLVLGGVGVLAAGVAAWMYYADDPTQEQLGVPTETKAGGFAPMAVERGLGLGYGGAF